MKLKFFATYRDITKIKEVDIAPPATAYDLLRFLAKRYGPAMERMLFTGDGAISENAILLVNGRRIDHLQGGDTPLTREDTVSLFPMVAGG